MLKKIYIFIPVFVILFSNIHGKLQPGEAEETSKTALGKPVGQPRGRIILLPPAHMENMARRMHRQLQQDLEDEAQSNCEDLVCPCCVAVWGSVMLGICAYFGSR